MRPGTGQGRGDPLGCVRAQPISGKDRKKLALISWLDCYFFQIPQTPPMSHERSNQHPNELEAKMAVIDCRSFKESLEGS